MVDQLWLWVIPGLSVGDPDTVITSFPERKGAQSLEEDDIATNVLKIEDRTPIFSTADLICRIINLCCKTLDRRQRFRSLQFLQFFENTVGNAVSAEPSRLFVNLKSFS